MRTNAQSHRPQRRQMQRRAGFTLMEILLVTAILVALASMATYAFVSLQKSSLSRAARTEIGVLDSACHMYHANVSSFPQTLNDLKMLPQGMDKTMWGGPYIEVSKDFNDPWMTEYRYVPDPANDRVTITSAGPDKSFDTADDVANINLN